MVSIRVRRYHGLDVPSRGMDSDLRFRRSSMAWRAHCDHDCRRRVEFANRQFLYLGASPKSAQELETSGVIHPDDLVRVVAAWRQSLERGEPFEIELRVRRANGLYHWVHARGLPLRDTQHRIVRWCVLLTDIAERKRAEALLEGEKRLLEMVASGCPLEDVLETMCRLVDTVVVDSVCSVLLIDAAGTFRYGAGPASIAGSSSAPTRCATSREPL